MIMTKLLILFVPQFNLYGPVWEGCFSFRADNYALRVSYVQSSRAAVVERDLAPQTPKSDYVKWVGHLLTV